MHMKRTLVVVAATATIAGGFTLGLGGGVASAHHPEIEVSTDCGDDGWTATYTVHSDADRDLTWSVNGQPNQADEIPFIFTESFGYDVASDAFSATATWSNGAGPETRTAEADRPDGCEATETTTTTLPPPPDPEFNLNVECDNWTLTAVVGDLFFYIDGVEYFIPEGVTASGDQLPGVETAVTIGGVEYGLVSEDCGEETTTTTIAETTTTVPPPQNCDTSAVVGSVASWLDRNGFDGGDCFDVVSAIACGSLDAQVTRQPDPGYASSFQFVWNEGSEIDLDSATAMPATFDEGYNGGTVDVTYYIVGPEGDWLRGSGLPNYWDGNDVTISVNTACESEETTTTTVTSTTVPVDPPVTDPPVDERPTTVPAVETTVAPAPVVPDWAADDVVLPETL